MSCQRGMVRWRASMAAVFLSFLLDQKGPKSQGRHHRTQRTKRTLPRHVGRSPRAQPSGGWAFPATDALTLLAVIADLIRNRELRGQDHSQKNHSFDSAAKKWKMSS